MLPYMLFDNHQRLVHNGYHASDEFLKMARNPRTKLGRKGPGFCRYLYG